MAKRHDLERMDLVKIDIEGTELEVLSAAKDVIDQYHPRFAIASFQIRDSDQTTERLEPMFRNFGYAVEIGFKIHRTTWAGPTL